ncbi:MAG: hypothetical protein Q8P57_02940 [Candidatus Pacearchaeota archaeon]|nr:hypothetical protein [Candidatus Pacearchaeota archaeon]
MDNKDIRLLIIAAFRYSLGRRTYMHEFIVNLIIKNSEIFNLHDWKRFIDEINEEENLGYPCDIQTWGKLVCFSENKLKNKRT